MTTPSIKYSATCTVLGIKITATCEYEAATATAEVVGGQTAKVVAASVPLAKTAGPESVCGAKADWSGTYEVTTPDSLFIES
jgi:hypothetical protein